MSQLELYSAKDLALIPWPSTLEGRAAKNWLTPLLLHGSQKYVQNVQTQLFVLIWGQLILPITVNRSEPNNSYVCSPFAHYVSYAKEELRELKNPALERVLAPLLTTLGLLLRLGKIDHVVHVNNWLLSTNLYPLPPHGTFFGAAQIQTITQFLAQQFSDCALIWRSISPNALETPDWPIAPQDFGSDFAQIPSRSVLLLDARGGIQHTKRDFKHDSKLLRRGGYHLRTATHADLPRAKVLYDLLYLQKYSLQNPQFTLAFFELALLRRTLELFVLERDGNIDGVMGFYTKGKFLTCPIFGYDITLPQDLGLYRMLSVHLALEAEKRGLMVHVSSGVAGFKRTRGAVAALEVSAVYTRHLPPHRRGVWWALERVIKRAWKLLEVRGL